MQVGIGAALLALLSTAGASAAVTGYQKVDTFPSYPNTSASSKSAQAKCPPGKRVLGAGGAVSYGSPGPGPYGKIVLNQLIPNVALGPQLEGASVAAFEDPNGTSLNWGLRAQAICANPPPGLEFVLEFSASGPAPFGYKKIYDTQAKCSPGKRLLGAGAMVTDGPGAPSRGDVVLNDVTPNAALTGVSVVAFEEQDDVALNWTLNAWLICADPLFGQVRVATTDYVASDGYKMAKANCPKGRKVLSAAGDLTGPGGAGGDLTGGGGVMDSLQLNGGPHSNEGVTVVARQRGGGPVNDRWFPHAYAICAFA